MTLVASILGLYLLFRLAMDESEVISKNYQFWIVGGVFLYFIGNIVLFSGMICSLIS